MTTHPGSQRFSRRQLLRLAALTAAGALLAGCQPAVVETLSPEEVAGTLLPNRNVTPSATLQVERPTLTRRTPVPSATLAPQDTPQVFHVRKSGSDEDGDGSDGRPWLTVSRTLQKIPVTSDATLLIGRGTYAENTAGKQYLAVQRSQAEGRTLTIDTESGTQDVTLTGGSSTAYQIRFDGADGMQWNNIVFSANSEMEDFTSVVQAAGKSFSRIEFHLCSFMVKMRTGVNLYGFFAESDAAFGPVLFDTCTFRNIGEPQVEAGAGLRIDTPSNGTAVHDITLKNCDFYFHGTCARLFALSNLLVDGGSFISSVGQALEVGVNDDDDITTSGIVRNAFLKSDSGISLLLGARKTDVLVDHCTVVAGDSGIVAKSCSGPTIQNNTITGGRQAALFFKGCQGAIATGKTVSSAKGWLLRLSDDSSLFKCKNVIVTDNTFQADSPAVLFDIHGPAELDSGCVVNNNRYQAEQWGKVYSSAVYNLETTHTAWSAYGDGSNDSLSTLLGP